MKVIQRFWMNYPFKIPFAIVFASDCINKNRGGQWNNRLSGLSRRAGVSDSILTTLQ